MKERSDINTFRYMITKLPLTSLLLFVDIAALTCACAALCRLFQGRMGAQACKQTVIRSQSSRGQHDGSAGG